MTITPLIMNTPNTQLYIFLFSGFIISFFWPINMLYVFLLTRAYNRDRTNLFDSFYKETIDLFKNTIILIKILMKKFNNDNSTKVDENKNENEKVDVQSQNTNNDNMENIDEESYTEIPNLKSGTTSFESRLRQRVNLNNSEDGVILDTI